MEEEPPIRITVYDKNYARKGYVTSPNSVSILLAWNLPGLTTFEVDASHSRVNDLVAEGSRCVVEYRPEGKPWKTVMSGIVSDKRGSGGPEAAIREFTVLDDLDVVNMMIDYQVPAQPASNQSAARHDVRTGPLETVFKGFASANITGRGYPRLTVQASAGLGDTVTVRHRMRNLGEHMLDAGIRRGLGWRVVQTGTTRQLQAWVPATYPRVLTEESGVVLSAEYSVTLPDVTRITVGIGGTWESRVFYDWDTNAAFADATAEALHGIVRHEFLDATDIENTDANRATLALDRAKERLLEGAAKSSLKAELIEAGPFRYGVSFDLGDKVSIKPAGAAVITDRVREVEINWDADGGLVVTPRVGEWSDDSASKTHWKATRTALRRVNDLGTR